MQKDAVQLATWWNDGAIMAHAGFPNGLGTTAEAVANQLKRDTDDTYRRLVIECDESPIGEMSYCNLENQVAEIGIKICDNSKQERGYGRILLSLLIDSLFHEYGYEEIILDTNQKNTRAQHVYTSLGFQQTGIEVDSWQNQVGELQTSIFYELNEENFINFAK